MLGKIKLSIKLKGVERFLSLGLPLHQGGASPPLASPPPRLIHFNQVYCCLMQGKQQSSPRVEVIKPSLINLQQQNSKQHVRRNSGRAKCVCVCVDFHFLSRYFFQYHFFPSFFKYYIFSSLVFAMLIFCKSCTYV